VSEGVREGVRDGVREEGVTNAILSRLYHRSVGIIYPVMLCPVLD
jgi:hypothetical protein